MWEINSNLQILSFVYAVAAGCVFSLIYDFFKSIRLCFKVSAFVIFFQDILYFSIISVLSFCFFLSFSNGEIRSYILLGHLLGAVVSRITFSKISVPFFRLIFSFLRKIITFFNYGYAYLERIFEDLFQKVKKILKKPENKVKNS